MQAVGRMALKILVGLFAFPFFSVLTAGLLISAIITLAAGLLRTFGLQLEMNLLLFEVPRFLSVPVALIFAALFCYVAFVSWKMLRLSYRFVTL